MGVFRLYTLRKHPVKSADIDGHRFVINAEAFLNHNIDER